jgi:hypothetical protein
MSQSELASELNRAAQRDSLTRHEVSRWERGEVVPGRYWRDHLCAVLAMPVSSLRTAIRDGNSASPGEQDLPGSPNEADYVLARAELVERLQLTFVDDGTVVSMLKDQTNYLRLLDRRMGGAGLTQQLDGHIAGMRDVLCQAVLARHRQPIAAELAGACTLAGWRCLDRGAIADARQHYDVAVSAAREADSPALLAHAMGEHSFVLIDLGQVAIALALVQEARAVAKSKVPRLLTSWLCATEAEVQAVAGNGDRSRKTFDEAARLLPDAPVDPALPYITLDHTHLTRWRGNILARLGDDEAIRHLYAASGAQDHSLRARAGLHTDLAYALTASGENDEAGVQLGIARPLAERAGSQRQRRRIAQLTSQRQDMQQRDQ